MRPAPKVNLGNITGNTDAHTIDFVKRGIDTLNRILASTEYQTEFMAFQFVQTNGMNNQQLWELFLVNSPVNIDVDIRDMGWWANHINKTIGVEKENFPGTIFMNSYFVDTAYMVGDNALHEVWHKLGLSHNKASDATSVPYGNNAIYESVAKTLNINPNV